MRFILSRILLRPDATPPQPLIHDMIVAMITSMSPQTLFAPFLGVWEVLPVYPPDLHGFVAIEVEKWLTKRFG
ncbi:MAG: hypothetical protein K8R34_00385 [Methanosarcinales archaeon]|nr:hypothetical protein [Methanosarcinales archaeon]